MLIFNTMETIIRQVNPKRRVGLPSRLARWSGIGAERWVEVRGNGARKKSLRVVPVSAPTTRGAPRDPNRPRKVTAVWQVTLPKEWMDQAGWKADQWVSLTSLGANQGLRLSARATPPPGPWSGEYHHPPLGAAKHGRRPASNTMRSTKKGQAPASGPKKK